MALASLVVLGCRVGPLDELSAPAARRVGRAAQAFHEGLAPRVLVCGGKRWRGVREADAFAAVLATLGVPASLIERELRSRSTLQNARYAAALVPPEQRRIGLVTCDFHMPRALHCFRSLGFEPTPIPASSPALPRLATRARTMREWLSYRIDVAATSLLSKV